MKHVVGLQLKRRCHLSLLQHCPLLTTVHVGGVICAFEVGDETAAALAQNCPHLTTVALSQELTDVSVTALAERCLHLTSVRFAYSKHLTDTSMSALQVSATN